VGGENLLFDLGPGTLRKALEVGFSFEDFARVFFTHFHVDHVSDLAPLLFACNNPRLPRAKPLPIYGAAGIEASCARLVDLYGEQILPKGLYTLKISELSTGREEFGSWNLTCTHLAHTEESLGYRVQDTRGRAVVYSGDTDYCANLVTLSEGADLLVLECSFPAAYKVEGHLTPGEAARVAREAGAKRLVLTHLYPLCDSVDVLAECAKGFDGEIIVAQDLMQVDV
jgi:ribonuclease BN (tRNA processing enzyme)